LTGVLVAAVLAMGAAQATPSLARPPTASGSGFETEHLFGRLAANDWEPNVAADPGSNWVYQVSTGIGAHQCPRPRCPGDSILFRASSDGGATWGPQSFVCGIACKGVHWQFDPEIRVADDGTIFAAWLNTFVPGTVLSKSSDHGAHWTAPVTMNHGLPYNDKPILDISPDGRDVYVAFNDKLKTYAVASHDYGAQFGPPVLVQADGLWWYAYGGAVAPNGDPYFAEVGETPNPQPPNLKGPQHIAVIRSRDRGKTWQTMFLAASEKPPTCPVPHCYQDFYSAQAAIAIDATGRMVFAYTANHRPGAPDDLYVRTSDDGKRWSEAARITNGGDATSPALATGPSPGDFRLAWQDDRNGATSWNTWFARSVNGGSAWSPEVRLSDRGSGASYKNPRGYQFPYGDYFGLAVGPDGTNHVIWGEGTGIYSGGGSWYTRGS
jgi:hypothetical protein